MKPLVGQRWLFDNSDATSYVAEIVEADPATGKILCKVLQIIKASSEIPRYVGEIFQPNLLSISGPLKDFWVYLPGQDKE